MGAILRRDFASTFVIQFFMPCQHKLQQHLSNQVILNNGQFKSVNVKFFASLNLGATKHCQCVIKKNLQRMCEYLNKKNVL